MLVKLLLELGDCFSIPLADGRFAFGQFLYLDPGHGPLIRVFDVISSEVVSLEVLKSAGLRFPPIAVGLNPPVRMKRWCKIGNFPVESLERPRFRFSLDRRRGINHDWQIWDGQHWEKVGDLNDELRSIECWGVWPYDAVEERILTGRDPFNEGIE